MSFTKPIYRSRWLQGRNFQLGPGPFLDAVEKLLNTAPPPKTAKDKADRATPKRTIKRARKAGKSEAGA